MAVKETEKFKSMNSDQKHNYINLAAAVVKDNITTVSFKIFDTLVLSGFWENSDVFHLLEKEFYDLYAGKKSFYELRKNAEEKAAKKSKTGKADYDEIYKQLESLSNISPDSAEKLKKRELELIEYFCYPRDCGMRLYNEAVEAGKKIALVTDSILPKETIGHILENCGIKNFNALFIKNEQQLKKSGGTIFPIIIKRLNLRQGQLVHVGGNVTEDVETPVMQGISAVYLPNIKELMQKSGRINAYVEKKLGKKFDSPEHLNLRCAMSLYAENFFDYPSQRVVSGDFCGSSENIGFLTLGTLGLMKDFVISSEIEAKVLKALSSEKASAENSKKFAELYDEHYGGHLKSFDYADCNIFFEYFVKHGDINDRILFQKYIKNNEMGKWSKSVKEVDIVSGNNTKYKFEKYDDDNELDAKMFPKGSKRRSIMDKLLNKLSK